MNFKNIFPIFCLFVLLFGVSSVFGEDFTLEGTTFEVPQGYSINKTGDISVTLDNKGDSNYTLFVCVSNFTDFDAATSSRQASGFKYLANETFITDNNITVHRQNFMKNESYFSYFTFEVNDTGYLIGYSLPVHGDVLASDDNPAVKIIESV